MSILKPTLLNINGYKFYYIRSNTDVTRIQSFVKAGSFNETKNILGLSHLLEHILIDSWSECSKNKISNKISNTERTCTKYWSDKGVSINAWTSTEIVSYHITGSKKYFDDMAKYLIEITTNPYYDEQIIEKCKKAIVEELLNNLNNPLNELQDKFFKTVFQKDPNKACIADNKTKLQLLNTITKNDLDSFYDKYYTKDNTIFLIVTNKTQNYTTKIITEITNRHTKQNKISFGSTNSNYKFKPFSTIKPVYIKSLKKTSFVVGFQSLLKNPFKELHILTFIADILCGDLSSVLYSILRDEKHLIYNISMDFESFDNNNIISIFNFSCKNENAHELYDAFMNIMISLKFTETQVSRSKERFRVMFLEKSVNTEFLGTFYGLQLIKFGKYLDYDQVNKMLDNITVNEVNKLSREIFVEPVVIIGLEK